MKLNSCQKFAKILKLKLSALTKQSSTVLFQRISSKFVDIMTQASEYIEMTKVVENNLYLGRFNCKQIKKYRIGDPRDFLEFDNSNRNWVKCFACRPPKSLNKPFL